MWVLDSNTISYYFRGDAQVVPRLQALRPAEVGVPAVVEYELRYSLLRNDMVNITDAALAANLKALLKDGIVNRQQFDEIPPRVEYTPTESRRSVIPILQSICQWAGR